MNTQEDIQRLISKLQYGHFYIRFNAANALIEIGEEAVPSLLDILDHSLHEGARAAAAYALGEIRQPQAVPALIRALELGVADLPTSVALYASEALFHIGTMEALIALEQWYLQHGVDSDGDSEAWE